MTTSTLPRGALLAATLLLAALTGCVGGVRGGRRPVFATDADARAAAGPRDADPAGRGREAADAGGADAAGPGSGPVIDTPVILEDRYVGVVSDADFAEFRAAWLLFVRKDRRWPEARDRWLRKGGAAPNVLSENLVRYFIHATCYGTTKDLNWVAVAAQKVGEPAVGYFGSLLLLDERPLDRPVQYKKSDGQPVELRVWRNDDVTRRDLSSILAAIGEPAVATLSTDVYLRQSSMNARRYVMRALGRVGSDAAVAALSTMLSAPEWRDRGAAAGALGVALQFRKNEKARAALERARSDPDEFVRRKVEEALSGKLKPD